jgi:hypothetical protein
MTSALTRRRLVRSGAAVAVGGPIAAFLAGCVGVAAAPPPQPPLGRHPERARRRSSGCWPANERFVNGEPLNAGRDDFRRAEIAEEQKPFAAILGGSDSRVPPDVVFDQGQDGKLMIVGAEYELHSGRVEVL